MSDWTERIVASRPRPPGHVARAVREAEEGGCGVVGFASSVPVGGRHIYEPSIQMHNRGNGKGGGIAAASLVPEQMGVDARTLREDYLLQVALLDPGAAPDVEREFVEPFLRVDHRAEVRPAVDHRELGLEQRPPDVVRYFVRVRDEVLDAFAAERGLGDAPRRAVEDEFIYQNTARLNMRFYASLGDQRAFVLSHARNLLVFKIVGYAEQVVQYYGLDDQRARIWIAHQRYPTKGRVWHPAGSHPFIGMNEALVHNGDFANYHAVSEVLCQHNISPRFLTDTEVSALLFDLLIRVYGYPLEHVIEAIAPTGELDLDRIDEDRRRAYQAIQSLHLHGSPDGPWFFIIARSEPDEDRYRLLGITDTSMLRPQVFALQEGDVTIGLVGSEKQAIDATLSSLSAEDPRFRPVPDRTWNARGGSYTDGGAFTFTVQGTEVTCADKFGRPIRAPEGAYRMRGDAVPTRPEEPAGLAARIAALGRDEEPARLFADLSTRFRSYDLNEVAWVVEETARVGREAADPAPALSLLALLNDRRFDCGSVRRSAVLELVRGAIDAILDAVPPLDGKGGSTHRRIDWETRQALRPRAEGERVLVIDAHGFPPEGERCDARLAVRAYRMGWRRFVFHRLRGQRFTGCGLGPGTGDVHVDVFGSSGDYLASGIDGLTIHVHDDAQDQLAQIMKSGRLVVHGDVGQAFLYGGKGGEIFVMGNAAGRPLINAVGRPRVVINGTALDYLAESFMAGDPHAGGGFVVLNGMSFDDRGRLVEQETPYPGSNLFSLASGGAIYVRDPRRLLVDEQLNGGEFVEMTAADWELVLPYLEENERLFGIPVETLLTVDGRRRNPGDVYRKVRAVKLAVLSKMQVPE
jgi:glutamate synthase domain-containing protein 1/glutamate synthase domain-containing protein 3